MPASLRESEATLGATFGEVAGVEVPRSFGDSLAEYTAVREAVGVAERGDLAQVRLWGREPVKMLQGLITNDLAGAPSGEGVYAAMLTAKGRMLAELRAFTRVLPTGTEVLVSLPREALAGSLEHFRRFIPPMYARWEDASARIGVLGAYGPHSRELLTRVFGIAPPTEEDAFVEVEWRADPDDERTTESVLVASTQYVGGEEGYDLFTAAAALPALWEKLLDRGADLGARPVGYGALDTLRIEAGRPRYGRELTAETIPTEAFESTGLMPRAISFTKGCYTGQEVIVRIAHRGHVNRNLRGLLLADAPAPGAGTPLYGLDAAKEIGKITSSAHSPLLRQTVSLGYLRREIVPGDRVRVGGPEGVLAEVTSLPFTAEPEQRDP